MKITALDIKGTLARFETLIRKFQEMNLDDHPQMQHNEPPLKKCKISLLEVKEAPNPLHSILAEAKPNLFPSSQSTSKNGPKLKKHSKKRSRTQSLTRLQDRNQNHRSHPKNKTIGSSTTASTTKCMPSPSVCASELGCFFSSCVNFIRASKLSGCDDIDWMVRTITRDCNVLRIQNHWVQSGPKQKWYGAMVTYSTPGDCQRALKRLHVDGFTDLNPIFIPDHLKLVGRLEERLMTGHPGQYESGSTVVLSSDSKYFESKRLFKTAEQFGDVQSFVRVQEATWKVTYQYTVQAVAAVLALDGKLCCKGRLRAVLDMGEKERRLHFLVAGHC